MIDVETNGNLFNDCREGCGRTVRAPRTICYPCARARSHVMSRAQFQAMTDIDRWGDPWARVRGQSQHGGWQGTVAVITKRKWAKPDKRTHKYELTDAGKTALRAERSLRGL